MGLTRAQAVAEAVIDELACRAGFDEWWCDIEEDVAAEILNDLADVVRHELDI